MPRHTTEALDTHFGRFATLYDTFHMNFTENIVSYVRLNYRKQPLFPAAIIVVDNGSIGTIQWPSKAVPIYRAAHDGLWRFTGTWYLSQHRIESSAEVARRYTAAGVPPDISPVAFAVFELTRCPDGADPVPAAATPQEGVLLPPAPVPVPDKAPPRRCHYHRPAPAPEVPPQQVARGSVHVVHPQPQPHAHAARGILWPPPPAAAPLPTPYVAPPTPPLPVPQYTAPPTPPLPVSQIPIPQPLPVSQLPIPQLPASNDDPAIPDLAGSLSMSESGYSHIGRSDGDGGDGDDESDQWSVLSTGPVDRQWTVVFEEKDEVV
ncbi:hypothetical protein EDC01DRAFT_780857 [Geopyxis carbonaria]|nr:hypothetical protein EDC01DRAFT_780857 [Geopyxis carbonaria]